MKKAELLCCPESMREHADKVLAGEYDLPAYLELVSPPTRVLDIGANVGAFTTWARAKWPECNVHAFEPSASNVMRFEDNHRNDDRVWMRSVAVMKLPGSVQLRLGLNNCGENSVYDVDGQMDEVVVVPGIAAGDLPTGDFIKIDTEGAEVEILEGIDLSSAQVLAYEWHGEDRMLECEQIVRGKSDLQLVKSTRSHATRGVCVWVLPAAVRAVQRDQDKDEDKDKEGETLPRLFLAVPVYGGVDPYFFRSVLDLMTATDRPYHLRIRDYIGDSLVCRARNRLVAEFLESDSTHLFFIDSDLIFSEEHVARIAQHAARGVQVVAGLYPKKQRELGWVCNMLEEFTEPDEHDLQPVKYAGTGFLCIAREVFLKMMEAYPESRYDPDDGDGVMGDLWDFFPVGVWECPQTKRCRYLSEDWWFCQRARDLGYEVMMDTRIVCKHVGQFIYPFDSPQSFADAIE